MATKDKRTWSQWRWSNYYFFSRVLKNKSHTLKLLDLGAGEGQFNDIFEQFKLTAVDFEQFDGIHVIADLTKDLPFKDNSYDIVTLSNTVEHIPDTAHLFSECYRLLGGGGSVVGTIPFLMQGHQEPYDFNRYTKFQLERLLSNAGFTDIVVGPLGNLSDVYYSFTLQFFSHLLGANQSYKIRLLRKGQTYLTKLIRLVARGVPSNNSYTEGFGFSAVK